MEPHAKAGADLKRQMPAFFSDANHFLPKLTRAVLSSRNHKIPKCSVHSSLVVTYFYCFSPCRSTSHDIKHCGVTVYFQQRGSRWRIETIAVPTPVFSVSWGTCCVAQEPSQIKGFACMAVGCRRGRCLPTSLFPHMLSAQPIARGSQVLWPVLISMDETPWLLCINWGAPAVQCRTPHYFHTLQGIWPWP